MRTRGPFARPAVRRAAVLAGLAAVALGTTAIPARADTTFSYAGSTTGTASTIVLHKGDSYERSLNPTASVTAAIDQTTGTVTSATTSFAAGYTDPFLGPFNAYFYVGEQLTQQGAATGTATPSGTEAVLDVTIHVTNRLAMTVYKLPTSTSPETPATDQKFTLPTRCWVDLAMTLTGTANTRTGALHLVDDPFTIPQFPGDPGDTTNPPDPNDTNHRCQTATTSLNQQVAGPNNSADLTFSGGPTTAHLDATLQSPASLFSVASHPHLDAADYGLTGKIASDVNFSTSTLSNFTASIDPVQRSTGVGTDGTTGRASFELLSTTGSLTPSGTTGVEDAAITATLRIHASVWGGQDTTGPVLANGTTCYVDVAFSGSGTLDQGTDELDVTGSVTIPSFPSGASTAEGCGGLASGLTDNVSGSGNSVTLHLLAG